MNKNEKIILKLDSYDVKQYEGERIVDLVILDEDEKWPTKKKFVLVYSKKLLANILAPVADLIKE